MPKKVIKETNTDILDKMLFKATKPIKKIIKKCESTVNQKKEAIDTLVDMPSSLSDYTTRLVSQNKEMYKNPPALPPNYPERVDVYTDRQPLPTRASNRDLIFEDHKSFKPNRSPEEVLRAGSFGGTYFRPIKSAVTNISYKSSEVLNDTVQPEWISGLDKATHLTSCTYKHGMNKYGVKCGGSLGMWESSGWMVDSDPYGWFQWYCRFFQGRRSSDDDR